MRRGAVANISEPDRIEFVQGGHRPAHIPPLPGDAREALDLILIDGARARTVLPLHASAPKFGGRSPPSPHHAIRMASDRCTRFGPAPG
jgi:hypothetical protein